LRVGLAVALVLGATGALLLARVASGDVAYYINPAFSPLVVAAGVGLLALAVARAPLGRGGGRAERRWAAAPTGPLGVAVLALPLAIGLLVAPRPLGSAALEQAGSSAPAGLANRPDPGRFVETGAWTLLDWAIARLHDPTLRRYADRPVQVVGFVHRTAATPADEFEVARFIVVCCSADGTATALRVRYPDAAALARDSWVRVSGTLAVEGSEAVVLADEVAGLPRPASPYLYP
jgi:uncharacterized repeat protein (TIGR03943 family)